MTDALALREGGAPDIAEIMTIMVDAFCAAFGEAWTRDQCLGVLGLPRVWATIARVDDQPAGFALSRTVVDEAELLLLAVRPQYRRAGIGTALVHRTMAVAIASGARKLHLEMREGNFAHQLYNRAGFGEVGRRRGYYRGADGKMFDALSLSVKLGSDASDNDLS
jgi:ribosomal-protein-alanine N-acetyltransferase